MKVYSSIGPAELQPSKQLIHCSHAQGWGLRPCLSCCPYAGQVTDVPYFGVTELAELQLAWATTVHKAQGSEDQAVARVLAPHHRVLLNRRLLYTGGSALVTCS